MGVVRGVATLHDHMMLHGYTGFCRIFATELEDRRPKTVPYLVEVVE